MEWMLMPLRRYAEFSGRSRRQEFWMFFLLQLLIYIGLGVLAFIIGAGAAGLASGGANGSAGVVGMFAALGIFSLVYLVVALGLLIPNIAVAVRRLHDTNRSGLWLLLPLVPYILGNVFTFMGAAANSTALAMLGGVIALIGLVAGIVLIVFYCLDGTPGPNKYGPDPKARGGVEGVPSGF